MALKLSPEFVNALEDKRVKFTPPIVHLPLKGKDISVYEGKISGILELPGEWLYESPNGDELKVSNVRCDFDDKVSIANVNSDITDVRFFTIDVMSDQIEVGPKEVTLKTLTLKYAPEFVRLANDVLAEDLLTTDMRLGEARTVISLESDKEDIHPTVSLSFTA